MTAGRLVATRAAFLAGGTAAVGVVGAVLPWRPETLCLLRAVTGVPCPFCGTTTAAARFADGDVVAAVAANPVTTTGALLLVLAPFYVSRVPPSWRNPVFTAAAALAWVWQLARFDLIPV